MNNNCLIGNIINNIYDLFEQIAEGDIHGLKHALIVRDHVLQAIGNDKCDNKINICVAALLHDVDDKKFFPNNKKCKNAKSILKKVGYPENDIKHVLKMIKLVSFSSNGNNNVYINYTYNETFPWKCNKFDFLPRDADRLEAIGYIGIIRCCCYGLEIKRPLVDARDIETIDPKDYNINYLKKIEPYSSMGYVCVYILARDRIINEDNIYLNSLFEQRKQEMQKIIDCYVKKGLDFSFDDIKRIILLDSNNNNLIELLNNEINKFF